MSRDAPTLVIVDDDRGFADALALEFEDRGYRVDWFDGLGAVEDRADLDYQYAVIDLRLRQDSGLDVISHFKARSPTTVMVVLTGYGSDAMAAEAIKRGAVAYVTKPIDIEQLELALLNGKEGNPRAAPDFS